MSALGAVVLAPLLVAAPPPSVFPGAEGPPLLADGPGAARAASGPARAEAWRLAGQPARALELVEAEGQAWPEATRLRVEAAARVALERAPGPRLSALAEEPGWAPHAATLARRGEDRAFAALLERLGLGLFAAALAGLVLGGSRALLRPSAPTAVAFAGAALGFLLARWLAPGAVGLVAVLGAGGLALVHAAAAARQRTLAGPRIRLLLATLVLLGATGQAVALGARFGVPGLFGRAVGISASSRNPS